LRIADVGAHLLFRAIREHILGYIEVGTETSAFSVYRVTANAGRREDVVAFACRVILLESCRGAGVFVAIRLVELLDRGEAPRPRAALIIRATAPSPNKVARPWIDLSSANGSERPGRLVSHSQERIFRQK